MSEGGEVCFEVEAERLWRSGLTREEIASKLDVSRVWVDTLPLDVDEPADGPEDAPEEPSGG